MTLTIDLSPEEEANLRARAARWGQDEATYAAGVLRHDIYTLPVDEELVQEQTLAEALAGRIGLFSSPEPSNAAQDSEVEFGKIMDEKRRTGHL
jgi:hypothetical protein